MLCSYFVLFSPRTFRTQRKGWLETNVSPEHCISGKTPIHINSQPMKVHPRASKASEIVCRQGLSVCVNQPEGNEIEDAKEVQPA
jgi:hypothetical protein